MARYPHAVWEGANWHDYNPLRIHPRFIVCHVAEGPHISGLDAWFHNPKARVSAHFGIDRVTGVVHQYVDTSEEAYAEMAYNDEAISIEFIGYSGQHLSRQQVASARLLFAWLHRLYGVPLVWRKNALGRAGVVGHGELGMLGGNHLNCPGEPIIRDIQALLSSMGRRPKFSNEPSLIGG